MAAEDADVLFHALVESHARSVGLFLAQLVDDRGVAEDLLQETLLAAYRSRDDLTRVENPEAWLFGIARHRALDAGRRQRRRRRLLDRLARSRPDRALDPADAAAVGDLLERHLEPHERALLILRYLHGFDAAELGVVFDASPEAIRQRLSRIRRRLRLRLEAAPSPPSARRHELRPRGPDVHQLSGAAATAEDEALQRLLAPLAAIPPVILAHR